MLFIIVVRLHGCVDGPIPFITDCRLILFAILTKKRQTDYMDRQVSVKTWLIESCYFASVEKFSASGYYWSEPVDVKCTASKSKMNVEADRSFQPKSWKMFICWALFNWLAILVHPTSLHFLREKPKRLLPIAGGSCRQTCKKLALTNKSPSRLNPLPRQEEKKRRREREMMLMIWRVTLLFTWYIIYNT